VLLKTLHRYLLRQIVATLVMTTSVFTFVLLFGNVLRNVLPLIISQRAGIGLIAEAVFLLVPFVWVFALPMAVLTATLLVFGRFSADQELTAARASGVSLLSLATPIVVLSLIFCVISAALNLDLAPRCRVLQRKLELTLKAALANMQIPERRYITFSGEPEYTVYVDRRRKQVLEDLLIYQYSEGTLKQMIIAASGQTERDKTNQTLLLHLTDAKVIDVANDLPFFFRKFTIPLDFSNSGNQVLRPKISDMTFSELKEELRRQELRARWPTPPKKASADKPSSDKATTNTDKATTDQRVSKQKTPPDFTEPIRVQIHRRVAFSFACFGFTLIGIPLGIRVHRRETNVGIAMALLLVSVYYGLIIAADSVSARPEFAPHLLMWLPNFVFQAVGAVLLWRANRGF
jgi:lipopolysaccharide export system permease protein